MVVPVCFKTSLLYLLTQKVAQKFGYVLGIEIGDGRIFVIPVEDTVRIRTGERGDIALYNAEQEK